MDDKASLIGEIETNTALSAFLGTVALFFTGILISQLKVFDSTIKIPILFLIISTFSFIFSASIYANASGELARHDQKKVHRYMAIANIISEFCGMYLFVLATPLVINAITHDAFLRVAVPIVAIGGLMFYSQSSFSILHRELMALPKMLVTILFGLLGLLIDLSQIHQLTGFTAYATALLIVVAILVVGFCFNPKQLDTIK